MDTNKKKFLETIATMYYVLNMSQLEIATQFNVGRSSVARYLNEAKEAGLIRFVVTGDHTNQRFTSLENRLIKKYPIKDMVVLKSDDENQFFTSIVSYLNSVLPVKGLIGIGGGHTLRTLSKYVGFLDKRPNVDIVQMIGNLNIDDTIMPTSSLMNIWADQLQSNMYFLSSPAIASNLQNKQSIQENEVINQIYEKYKEINLCVIGIGNVNKHTHIIKNKMFTQKERDYIEQNCIGDVCLHFYDKEGQFNCDALSDLSLGISRENFLSIPFKIAIAYGEDKTEAIHAALKNDLVNILITDNTTAEQLL